MNWTVTIF